MSTKVISSGIKVFAPATVANVACGFDALGFALDKPGDEIFVKPSNHKGLRITEITGAKGKLPYEVEKNTAGLAALEFLKHIGEEGQGFDMKIHKKMPFGSGLGSSAASAVGGVWAMNCLFKQPLTKRECLPFAMKGEQLASGDYHADNVAPSLLGGLILCRDNATLDVHRIYTPKGLYAVVVYPEIEILTKDSRSILSDKVDFKSAIKQCSNMAGFVLGMQLGDLSLVKRSLEDVLVEPQRAKLIPGFYDIQNASLEKGALGCSISGAGPSIFSLCDNSLIAEEVASAKKAIFDKLKIKSTVYVSQINNEGVVLI